jgi:hypothetical protein
MCCQNDVCATSNKIGEFVPAPIKNFYLIGLKNLKEKFKKKGRPINKLRPLSMGVWDPNSDHSHLGQAEEGSNVSSSGNN